MIARIWRGVVQLNDADVYADYIRQTGFAEYAQTPGDRGAWIFRHRRPDRVHHPVAVELRRLGPGLRRRQHRGRGPVLGG
jgi:hypothetical protein